MAFHLEWEDLAQRLTEFVILQLGAQHSAAVKRSDFYYWDMKLHSDQEIDEERSKHICEKLCLQNIGADHFVDSDWVDQNQMRPMLEELFQREIVSSHADDEGGWFFHKPLHASSKEWIARCVDRFEHRLRMEIRNRHYPITNKETAAHQLYSFVKALADLGLVGEYDYRITPDYFADAEEPQE